MIGIMVISIYRNIRLIYGPDKTALPDEKDISVTDSYLTASAIIRVTFPVTLIVVMVSCIFTGFLLGIARHYGDVASVKGRCATRCFYYRVDGKVYLGRMVAQDKDLTAIYTPSGLLLFEAPLATRT
jgi:hypothetical protein